MIAFHKVKTLHSFLSSLSILETVYNCSREEKAAPSILDSCSQYSNADDWTSSKIKCNIGYFYDKVDKLSCHERCDIVHNV